MEGLNRKLVYYHLNLLHSTPISFQSSSTQTNRKWESLRVHWKRWGHRKSVLPRSTMHDQKSWVHLRTWADGPAAPSRVQVRVFAS